MTQQDAINEQTRCWDHLVAGRLDRSVHQVGFFQAIRRVEEIARDLPRVGHASQIEQEALRIRQTPELDFAPATIDRIDTRHDGRAELRQRFFGLLGPSGPLPLHLTEQARHETRHRHDPALESFLNLFHHRMAVLFYRSWSSSRGAIQRDRPDEDRYSEYLSALSGVLHRVGPTHNDADTQIHFSGRFASTHRNAEGLGGVVSASLQTGAKVQSFILRYLRLESEDRTTLSSTSTADGRGGRLGRSVVLGRSVPDRRCTVGLEIGPVAFDLFQKLLPGGSLHWMLAKLIRGYVDPSIDCRVQLVLDRDTVPRATLGRQAVLGRSTWLNCKSPRRHAGDCQFVV